MVSDIKVAFQENLPQWMTPKSINFTRTKIKKMEAIIGHPALGKLDDELLDQGGCHQYT